MAIPTRVYFMKYQRKAMRKEPTKKTTRRSYERTIFHISRSPSKYWGSPLYFSPKMTRARFWIRIEAPTVIKTVLVSHPFLP